MSTETLSPDTKLTATDIHNAVRNEYPGQSFMLGDREFPIKSLAYDDYLEFVDLARPIVEAVANSLELQSESGDPSIGFNPVNLDFKQLIKLAGTELPRMAWICCKQSDPKISINDVKRLARRPFPLIEIVLLQVKHNELVKEFQSFFPRLGKIIGELVPQVEVAAQTVPVGEPSETQSPS